MGMRKSIKRLIFFFVVLLFATFSVFAYLFATQDSPPVEDLKLARTQITKAKNFKANEYALGLLKKSIELYDSAMINWKIENEKISVFRNYDSTRYYAKQSILIASKAIDKSSANSKVLNLELAKTLRHLQKTCDEFQRKFDKLPIDQLKKQNSKGRLLLGEARISYEKNDLKTANEKIREAKVLIEKSYKQASATLTNYFNNYSQWKKWVDISIKQSAEKREALIVVDKYSRTCLVYQNGVVKEKFNIELGKNWMGTKLHQGDQATPEGTYKVVTRKEKHKTKYYKALLINYPNKEDEQRFNNNKKNGLVKANKKIGGLIEIHGGGGQGVDWTDGCVALRDKEMDRLFALVSVGTPVVIVGSLLPLDAVLR